MPPPAVRAPTSPRSTLNPAPATAGLNQARRAAEPAVVKAAWPAAQGEEAAVALSLAQMLRVDIPEDLCGGAMGGVVVKEPYDNCCSLSQSFSEAALA